MSRRTDNARDSPSSTAVRAVRRRSAVPRPPCHSAPPRHRPASAASSMPPRACSPARPAIHGASTCCRCGCGGRRRRTWTSSSCGWPRWRPRRRWRSPTKGPVSLTGSDGSDTPVFTGTVDGIHERPNGMRLVTATNGSRELAAGTAQPELRAAGCGAIIEASPRSLASQSERPGNAPTLPRFVVDDRVSSVWTHRSTRGLQRIRGVYRCGRHA